MSRSSRRNATSALATVVILILAGLVFLFQQVTGGGPPVTAGPPTLVGGPPSISWYQLYFTAPEAGLTEGGLPAKIALSLDTAQRTIDVAVYEFELTSLSDALIRAAQRGVRVRVVTDSDSLVAETILDLLRANIPVVEDQRSAIMHDKFVIIDGVTVWTGSMNFTPSDAYRNNNNMLMITSTRLGQNYTAEFEEMFTRRQFGPTSPADTPNPSLEINGVRVENYFAPEDGVAARLRALLAEARESIYFMAFSFTRTDLAEVLVERARAGVAVQGVFETRQIAAGGDAAWKLLTDAGLDVRQDGNAFNLHNKVFIIDRRIVITGSYNFSRNAEENNDENVLILYHPDIAAAYYAEWQKVWAEAAR